MADGGNWTVNAPSTRLDDDNCQSLDEGLQQGLGGVIDYVSS